MNRSTHWNDVRVALGTKITYECEPNMYFEGQDRPENRTIELECLGSSGQFTTPDPWPVCSMGKEQKSLRVTSYLIIKKHSSTFMSQWTS